MKKGFTVIEVIVTFVILSILIFFAIYSFRYSIDNVVRASYYLPKTTITFSTLDRVLGGIYYYGIEKKPKEFVEYFDADQTYINFITTAPLYNDRITLAKIEYKDKKLIYSQEPLYHKQTNIEAPKLTKDAKKIIFFDQVSYLEINYILKNGDVVSKVFDEIPKGIVFNLIVKGKKYHFIFAPLSNFLQNKINVYHEKYQI